MVAVDQKVVKIELGTNTKEKLKLLHEARLQIERKVHKNATHAVAYLLPGDEKVLDMLQFKYTEVKSRVPKSQKMGRKIRNGAQNPIGAYHHYPQLVQFLEWINVQYPNITRLYSIGKSVQNRELWVMDISKNVNVDEQEPRVKYVGNMHGDETVGREILIDLIYHLVVNYENDTDVAFLLDNTHISIMPTMNPDGFELARRSNANGYDLNRNFPDQYRPRSRGIQPETRAVMEWSKSGKYSLSINFHGGDLCANYPFDGNAEFINGKYSATPDDALFRKLALTYSTNHRTMSTQSGFPNGITNGAEWYILYGGMQDWNYLNTNDYEITVELSYNKYPSESTLATEWENNKPALIEYLKFVHKGVKGVVTDPQGRALSGAVISVFNVDTQSNIDHTIQTSAPHGDYYRLLLPGTYEITATVDGFNPIKKTVVVDNGPAKVVNFGF